MASGLSRTLFCVRWSLTPGRLPWYGFLEDLTLELAQFMISPIWIRWFTWWRKTVNVLWLFQVGAFPYFHNFLRSKYQKNIPDGLWATWWYRENYNLWGNYNWQFIKNKIQITNVENLDFYTRRFEQRWVVLNFKLMGIGIQMVSENI